MSVILSVQVRVCAVTLSLSLSLHLPLPSYLISSFPFTLSFVSVDVFLYPSELSFFPRNVYLVFWSWIKKESHTQSVSEQAFSWGRKSIIYPWRMGWKTSGLLEVALCIQEVARIEGIWLLKVAWVMEGRAQVGVHGKALRGC